MRVVFGFIRKKIDNCDLQAIELATFLRRHVPGIVSDTKAVLDGADAVERHEVVTAMGTELRSFRARCPASAIATSSRGA